MALPLLPHQARYTILDAGGADAGSEELAVIAGGAGLRITSTLTTDFPVRLDATLDWELDRSLTTRRLLVNSRLAWGDECELELTVTGNGLLAHRTAPDGPTQVELGWGPNADLDYISAAFAAVMAARSPLRPGDSRQIETVHIGAEDLLPEIVTRELTRIKGPGDGIHLLNRAVATGHTVELELDPSGALRAYAGLLRLDRLSLLPAPTK